MIREYVGNEDFVLGWRATIERILVDALADSGVRYRACGRAHRCACPS